MKVLCIQRISALAALVFVRLYIPGCIGAPVAAPTGTRPVPTHTDTPSDRISSNPTSLPANSARATISVYNSANYTHSYPLPFAGVHFSTGANSSPTPEFEDRRSGGVKESSLVASTLSHVQPVESTRQSRLTLDSRTTRGLSLNTVESSAGETETSSFATSAGTTDPTTTIEVPNYFISAIEDTTKFTTQTKNLTRIDSTNNPTIESTANPTTSIESTANPTTSIESITSPLSLSTATAKERTTDTTTITEGTDPTTTESSIESKTTKTRDTTISTRTIHRDATTATESARWSTSEAKLIGQSVPSTAESTKESAESLSTRSIISSSFGIFSESSGSAHSAPITSPLTTSSPDLEATTISEVVNRSITAPAQVSRESTREAATTGARASTRSTQQLPFTHSLTSERRMGDCVLLPCDVLLAFSAAIVALAIIILIPLTLVLCARLSKKRVLRRKKKSEASPIRSFELSPERQTSRTSSRFSVLWDRSATIRRVLTGESQSTDKVTEL